ncbi:MAG: hypothetical protein H6907_09935 [Hyphomicrobiales bacterium]|nr:hypothetical protein [Hyphomicrobiales bacterium]MCP5372038.1 hypothetical protein [Hyphomicrobiales bacterium]
MGIVLSERQMKRAAEPDARGQRKLPFFVDPIEGRLRIEKSDLLRVYFDLQNNARNTARFPSLN